MGEDPEGSEGRFGGQGHRSQDSKGWAEGYDQVNKK